MLFFSPPLPPALTNGVPSRPRHSEYKEEILQWSRQLSEEHLHSLLSVYCAGKHQRLVSDPPMDDLNVTLASKAERPGGVGGDRERVSENTEKAKRMLFCFSFFFLLPPPHPTPSPSFITFSAAIVASNPPATPFFYQGLR